MIKPTEMEKRLGVSVKTLQRWDLDGTWAAHRTPKIEGTIQKNNT